METCKYLRDCEFFNNPNTQQFQVLADQLKADYCQGRFADCARFRWPSGWVGIRFPRRCCRRNYNGLIDLPSE